MQRRAGGATRERMLRELAEAVEALTRPAVVLVLEDLHWSDGSTVDWLASVARRRERARLLVLGMYRPVEAVVHAHPVWRVTQELQVHGQGVELAVGYLPEAEVALSQTALWGGALPGGLARVLHQCTGGNPLVFVTLVHELMRQGVLREGVAGWELSGGAEAVAAGVPETLYQLIDQQFEQFSPAEQPILEAASVAGNEVAVATVAACVDHPLETVERQCAALARRGQFARHCGADEWPDGTVAARYGFLHALYRETLYNRVPTGRRVRWHRQIGDRLEAGYGVRAREIAAELAEDFVPGQEPWRAVQYLHYAGENALRRSAYQEAIAHLNRGLELLQRLPETPERVQQGDPHADRPRSHIDGHQGVCGPRGGAGVRRARELCQQVGETHELFRILIGLHMFYRQQAELQSSYEVGKQLLAWAESAQAPQFLLVAHQALGTTLYFLGAFAQARTHLEQGVALYDTREHRIYAVLYGQDSRGSLPLHFSPCSVGAGLSRPGANEGP